MTANGLQNRWNELNVKWATLSKSYKVDDFYIACENEGLVCVK